MIRQLIGADARRVLAFLANAEAPLGTEAMIFDPRTEEVVFYQKLGHGYVRFDDWGTLNVDVALKSVVQIVEAGNIRRRQTGLPGIHVIGWLEPPNLDRSTNIVRWAIEAAGEHGKPVITSVALIFGRDGFEKLTWAGNERAVGRQLLGIAQSSFSFPVGNRYADYQPGDRIAEFGVADIVAALLGAQAPLK